MIKQVSSVCGNNIVERALNEECDNTADPVACVGCKFAPGFGCSDNTPVGTTTSFCFETCGDGKNMGRNACDDGNVKSRDGCSNKCAVEAGWKCNGGGKTQPDTCFEICGDKYDFWTKPCEDGDGGLNSGGCDSNCNLNQGYECQGGDPVHADTCWDKCGDGFRLTLAGTTTTQTQACDDGNNLPGDGCDSICRVEADCTCSGGNTWSKDVCTEFCGDGLNMGILACDDGNSVAGDGCDQFCNVELGWACGQSSFAKFDLCYEICGDGRNLGQYQCDDGNIYNGDGCSSKCIYEYGYSCSGGTAYSADTCKEVCGDGINMHTYTNECDDYNNISGDGCSSSCEVEVGWTCAGGTAVTADTCTEIPLDGRQFHRYFCDDGNKNNLDGCDTNSKVEPGWTCAGGNGTTPDFCWQPHPRIVSAYLSTNNTVITLNFNETTYLRSNFTKSNILVYITGPRDKYQYGIEWLNTLYYKGSGQGFTSQQVQLDYDNSGQFFGLNSEAIVFAVLNGYVFENERYGYLIESVWVLYANPRESDYKCEMDKVWEYSYYAVFIIFGLNFIGYFIDMSMNYFWSLAYYLQIVGLLPLIQVYMPSCASLYIKDMSIVNGNNYFIQTNFLQNTYNNSLLDGQSTYWYGFTRNGYSTGTFLGDGIGALNCWLWAVLLVFFFNFVKGLFPEEPFFVKMESTYRWQALYKGIQVTYTQLSFCAIMNLNNMNFSNPTLGISATLAAVIFTMEVAFPFIHFYQALKYRKLLKNEEIKELMKFKWTLLFGEFADTSFIRYFFFWVFALRRILNACIIIYMQNSTLWTLNLLLFVNLLALIYSCISRPYHKTINNVMLIVNDVGVLISICTFYPMRNLYVIDDTFYLYGKIVIGVIAGIVFLNVILFLMAFIIAIIDFLKRCPICTFCICKKRLKEMLIIDPNEIIEKEEKEVKPPTPPPTPPPKEITPPTPEPTPTPPSPTPEIEEEEEEEEEEKQPSEDSDQQIDIPSAAVIARDQKFKNEGEENMGETMMNTQQQQLNLVNPQRFVDQRKVKFADNLAST